MKTEQFLENARRYWSPERLENLLGTKAVPVRPDEAPLLLYELGLLASDGSMPRRSARKFNQINHMIRLLEPYLRGVMARHETVRLVDLGCGNSYLSLLLAWLFQEKWHHRLALIGVDQREDVIAHSRQSSDRLGLTKTARFWVSGLGNFEFAPAWKKLFSGAAGDADAPQGVLALHACDTASDEALAFAIKHAVEFFAVAPCCQAELAAQWELLREAPQGFRPIFAEGNLRRDFAATTTDALRMLLCRARGFKVTATEFVESTHTAKNRVLLGTRHPQVDSLADYAALRDALGGCSIRLEHLLASPRREIV